LLRDATLRQCSGSWQCSGSSKFGMIRVSLWYSFIGVQHSASAAKRRSYRVLYVCKMHSRYFSITTLIKRQRLKLAPRSDADAVFGFIIVPYHDFELSIKTIGLQTQTIGLQIKPKQTVRRCLSQSRQGEGERRESRKRRKYSPQNAKQLNESKP
jgi:hypothetical protein